MDSIYDRFTIVVQGYIDIFELREPCQIVIYDGAVLPKYQVIDAFVFYNSDS